MSKKKDMSDRSFLPAFCIYLVDKKAKKEKVRYVNGKKIKIRKPLKPIYTID